MNEMPKSSGSNKTATSRGRTVLIACAALALITIQVIDWSLSRFDRKLSDNHIKYIGIPFSSLGVTSIKNAVLIPAEGPDPIPHEIIENLRGQDPRPIDPLCRPTSQVIITKDDFGHERNNGGPIIMQSLSLDGKPKTVGGDEYYVTYTDGPGNGKWSIWNPSAPDAVARIVDLDDGRYELHFVQPQGPTINGPRLPISMLEGQGGKLDIHLEYTCSVGSLWPPAKANWVDGGHINSHWEAQLDASMVPSIEINEDRPMPQRFGYELKRYRTIHSVGNSMIRTFVLSPGALKRRTNIGVGPNNPAPLNLDTLPTWLRIVAELHHEESMDSEDIALLLGSGMWDLVHGTDENMDNHLLAVELYINKIRLLVPRADIYWKSMTATHTFAYNKTFVSDSLIERARESLRYVSRSRAQDFHEAQVKLMQRLNVPVIDMFNMTFDAAEWHSLNDALHFNPEFNDYLMDYFYPRDDAPLPLSPNLPSLLASV